MQYQVTLVAGVPKRQGMQGATFVLLDTGAAATIDLSIEITGFASEELKGVRKGLTVKGSQFTSVLMTSSVNTTVQVIATQADVSINYNEGQAVNATIVGTPTVRVDATQFPLPVTNDRGGAGAPVYTIPDRGAPGNPQYVTGITYSDAPAVTLQDNAAVAVTSAGQSLVAANAARRGLRFTNIGTDPVALGFTGITWAKRCIVLNSGDSWVETRATNLAWAAICDAAKTASVTVQEVIA